MKISTFPTWTSVLLLMLIEHVLTAKTGYEVVTRTGNEKNAGTNAKVFITIYGANGRTAEKRLKEGLLDPKPFKRGRTDKFDFKEKAVGDLTKITIRHDNSGRNPSWYLESVSINVDGKAFDFPCQCWLDSSLQGISRTVFAIEREVPEALTAKTGYEVVTRTGNEKNAGTKAKVFITIYGANGRTAEKRLKEGLLDAKPFKPGRTDKFDFKEKAVGDLTKITIRHDNSGRNPSWYLESVSINVDGKTFDFPCQCWLDSSLQGISRTVFAIEREVPEAPEPEKVYKVTTKTGNLEFAGTDEDVFIQIFGEKGSTESKQLTKGKFGFKASFKNLFEQGNKDSFEIKAKPLGRLTKIVIGHHGTGLLSGWFLANVKIKVDGVQYNFPCNCWLDQDKGGTMKEIYAQGYVPPTQSTTTNTVGSSTPTTNTPKSSTPTTNTPGSSTPTTNTPGSSTPTTNTPGSSTPTHTTSSTGTGTEGTGTVPTERTTFSTSPPTKSTPVSTTTTESSLGTSPKTKGKASVTTQTPTPPTRSTSPSGRRTSSTGSTGTSPLTTVTTPTGTQYTSSTSTIATGHLTYSSAQHYWPFDVQQGNISPDIIGGKDAYLAGNAQLVPSIRRPSVVATSGDAISLGDFKGTCFSDPTSCVSTGISVMFWVELQRSDIYRTPLHDRYLVSSGAQTKLARGFFLAARPKFGLYVEVVTADQRWESLVPEDGLPEKWSNIAFSWNGDKGLQIFINGEKAGKTVFSKAKAERPEDKFTVISINKPNHKDDKEYQTYFKMDDLAFYSRYLTGSDIKQILMNTKKTIPVPPGAGTSNTKPTSSSSSPGVPTSGTTNTRPSGSPGSPGVPTSGTTNTRPSGSPGSPGVPTSGTTNTRPSGSPGSPGVPTSGTTNTRPSGSPGSPGVPTSGTTNTRPSGSPGSPGVPTSGTTNSRSSGSSGSSWVKTTGTTKTKSTGSSGSPGMHASGSTKTKPTGSSGSPEMPASGSTKTKPTGSSGSPGVHASGSTKTKPTGSSGSPEMPASGSTKTKPTGSSGSPGMHASGSTKTKPTGSSGSSGMQTSGSTKTKPIGSSGIPGMPTSGTSKTKPTLPSAAVGITNLDGFRRAVAEVIGLLRRMHSSDPLILDKEINSAAQRDADKMSLNKRALIRRDAQYSSNVCMDIGTQKDLALNCASQWYSTVKDYDWLAPRLTSDVQPFINLVWRATKRLGVGVKKLLSGKYILLVYFDTPGIKQQMLPGNVWPTEDVFEPTLKSKCPENYKQVGQTCITFHSSPQTWESAVEKCAREGAILWTLQNIQEENTIKAIIAGASTDSVWLGLHDRPREGSFMAVSGRPVHYLNWFPNEPNGGRAENCVDMATTTYTGSWADRNCAEQRPFMCRKPLPGIVSYRVELKLRGAPVPSQPQPYVVQVNLQNPYSGYRRNNIDQNIHAAITEQLEQIYSDKGLYMAPHLEILTIDPAGNSTAQVILKFQPNAPASASQPLQDFLDNNGGKFPSLNQKVLRVSFDLIRPGTIVCTYQCFAACSTGCQPTCCASRSAIPARTASSLPYFQQRSSRVYSTLPEYNYKPPALYSYQAPVANRVFGNPYFRPQRFYSSYIPGWTRDKVPKYARARPSARYRKVLRLASRAHSANQVYAAERFPGIQYPDDPNGCVRECRKSKNILTCPAYCPKHCCNI